MLAPVLKFLQLEQLLPTLSVAVRVASLYQSNEFVCYLLGARSLMVITIGLTNLYFLFLSSIVNHIFSQPLPPQDEENSQTLTVLVAIPDPCWYKACFIKCHGFHSYGYSSHIHIYRSRVREFNQHQVIFPEICIKIRMDYSQCITVCLLSLIFDVGLMNSQSDFISWGKRKGREMEEKTVT